MRRRLDGGKIAVQDAANACGNVSEDRSRETYLATGSVPIPNLAQQSISSSIPSERISASICSSRATGFQQTARLLRCCRTLRCSLMPRGEYRASIETVIARRLPGGLAKQAIEALLTQVRKVALPAWSRGQKQDQQDRATTDHRVVH
jgi:hypothetical protein